MYGNETLYSMMLDAFRPWLIGIVAVLCIIAIILIIIMNNLSKIAKMDMSKKEPIPTYDFSKSDYHK
jgi:hypothetical protein